MPKFNPDKALYSQILEFSKQSAIINLLESGVDANFTQVILDRLNSGTGQEFSELLDELRLLIEGGTVGGTKRLGLLERYVKQVNTDALNQFTATYNTTISQDMGLSFYQYTGGLIKDSREFCVERAGKFFHKNEVDGWGLIPGWQGRIAGTNPSNIYVNRGGWNCRHQIIGVLADFVPRDVIIRNVENGNFKPNKRITELFGL